MEPTEPLESAGDSDVGEPLATAAMALARRFAGGRHAVVHRARVARTRPPRRCRVRPSRARRQARPAGHQRRRRRPRRVAARRSCAPEMSCSAISLRRIAGGRRGHASSRRLGRDDDLDRASADDPPNARPNAADHVVWVDGHESESGSASAVHDGRLVLLYHVLWELTHVCFEHPGLLDDRPARRAATMTSASPAPTKDASVR